MQKITPFLWFDGNAEQAMDFYVSVFKDSKIVNVSRNGDQVITGTIQLEGQEFMVLNGGPEFRFTEAVSFFVSCNTQEEVDYFWGALSAGGEESQCGWLKDRFGLSWQIIPTALGEMFGDPDREKADRAMNAMLQMKKIDIATLRQAFQG